MSFGQLPANPFTAGPMITDPRLFVGRRRTLRRLAGMVQQPVSANITGERRIGKSSLIYHFYQTWEDRVRDSRKYCVIYLDLQDARCSREKHFYEAVLQALGQAQQHYAEVGTITQSSDRLGFAREIRQWKEAGVLPVLCLDTFETLFEYTSEFNDGFFDNLRSLMNSSDIMLILASRKSLDFHKRKHRLTSDFFNLGQVIKIEDLEAAEVNELLRLPASTVPGSQAAIGTLEQGKAENWGGQHPCKLQHAANFLWQAGQHGYGEQWARERFLEEADRLPKRRRAKPNPMRVLENLGKLSQGIGDKLDNFSNRVTGMAIVIFVLLTVFGVFRRPEAKAFFEKLLGG